MKQTMKYKGFIGSAEFSMEDMVLHGKLLFINDLINYEAETPSGLKTEFEAAVDDYIATCAQLNREPHKPCSGTFNVRIGAELHQKLAIYSTLNGIKINNLVKMAVDRFIEDPEQKAVVHNHYHAAPHAEIKRSMTFNRGAKVVPIRSSYVSRYN